MQTGTSLLLIVFFFNHPIKELTDISVRNMFYSSDVLVDKLLQCSLNLKIVKNEYENIPQAELISYHDIPKMFSAFFYFYFFCIKSDLHSNVNTVCGQRRVCVLCSTPRSQQT